MPTLQEISALAQQAKVVSEAAEKKRLEEFENAKAARLFEIFKGKVRSKCEECAKAGYRSWLFTDQGSPTLLRLIEAWTGDPENKWAVENRIAVCPRYDMVDHGDSAVPCKREVFIIEIRW